MLLSLVAALAVASMTTSTRHVVVPDTLELNIPAPWQNGGTVTPPPGYWKTLAIFQSGQGGRHTLTVAGLDLGRPTAPAVAIKIALLGLQVHGHSASNDPLQIGAMTGQLFRGWSDITIGRQRYTRLHMIALLTSDGTYYHVIYLKKLVISTVARPNRLTFPSHTFRRILESVSDLRLRPANHSQIADAGLALHPPAGMRAMVSPDHLHGDGILLLDTTAGPHVTTIRAIGIPDPGGNVPSDPLWPGSLLESQFIAIAGRGPSPDEAGQSIETTLPHWWVQWSEGSEGHGMMRRLSYYRFSEQRGLLLEAVCEAAAANAHWRRTDVIAAGIRTAIETTRVDPLVGVDGALRRGEQFRQRQQSMLTHLLKANTRPFLLSSPRGIYGYEIRQILQTNFNRRLPVAGIVRRRIEGESPCERNVAWMASADGSECQWETRTACATGGRQQRPVHVRIAQLRIRDGQITLETASDGEATTAWSTAMPSPFIIPPMQDRWPAALLSNPQTMPCLVWMCDTRRSGSPRPPMPIWIKPQTNFDPGTKAEGLILRHRPMMALKADLALLAPDGQITRFVARADSSWKSATGSVTFTETPWPELIPQIQRNRGAWDWIRKLFDKNPSMVEESR